MQLVRENINMLKGKDIDVENVQVWELEYDGLIWKMIFDHAGTQETMTILDPDGMEIVEAPFGGGGFSNVSMIQDAVAELLSNMFQQYGTSKNDKYQYA